MKTLYATPSTTPRTFWLQLDIEPSRTPRIHPRLQGGALFVVLVEKTSPVHKKQLLTYLKLTDLKLGYLLNFGDELMKNGITRIINGDL